MNIFSLMVRRAGRYGSSKRESSEWGANGSNPQSKHGGSKMLRNGSSCSEVMKYFGRPFLVSLAARGEQNIQGGRGGPSKEACLGVGSAKNDDSLYLVGACSVYSARHSVSIFARTRSAHARAHGFLPCRSFGESRAATAPTAAANLENHSTPLFPIPHQGIRCSGSGKVILSSTGLRPKPVGRCRGGKG